MLARLQRLRVPVIVATLMFWAQCGRAAYGQKHASLDLGKVLGGGERACTIPGSAQFLSQDALLLLVGPDSNCYQHVRDLELVVVSTDGAVLARKAEPSSFPVVILSEKRIVLTQSNRLIVLDDRLQTIQTIDLPRPDRLTALIPRRIGTDLLAIRDIRGPIYIFTGNPLRLVSDDSKELSSLFRTFTLNDGRTVKLTDKSLVETDANSHDRLVGSLAWVNPCSKLCQDYDAGLDFSVATEGATRILVISNGSRFPVTDAAGLFPYFRVEVFNWQDGSSVYREQFITQTGHRTAAISPAGNLLVISNGSHIDFKQLH